MIYGFLPLNGNEPYCLDSWNVLIAGWQIVVDRFIDWTSWSCCCHSLNKKKLGNWMKGGRVETISWTKKKSQYIIHKKAENEKWLWRRQAIWPKVDLFWHICYFVPGSLRWWWSNNIEFWTIFLSSFFCETIFSTKSVKVVLKNSLITFDSIVLRIWHHVKGARTQSS